MSTRNSEPKPVKEPKAVSETDALRRKGFIDWFNRRAQAIDGRKGLMSKTGLSKGRISQFFDEAQSFGEDAASRIEGAYDELTLGIFLELGKQLIQQNRAHITAEIVGMHGKGGHSGDVKGSPPQELAVQILPLIPFNRVDLMLLPNDAPEVRGLETMEVRPSLEPTDALWDKAMIVETDIAGTEVKQGYVAVFRAVPSGKRIRPIELPIAVKSPSGTFHLMSYNALAIAPADTVVIAVCIDAYRPRKPGIYWD